MKRKLMGIPVPVILTLAVILLAFIIIGFLAGPIGYSLFKIEFPEWLVVEQPNPKLPAEAVFHIFSYPITNTILASWITVIFLVVFSWAITRRMQIVPRRLQAVFEAILVWIYDLCRSVAGDENGRKFFPVVCTIFLYVGFNAWLSLIPGFGSFHFTNHEGHVIEIFRAANTDFNTPLAIAVISFFFVAYYGFKSLKIGWLRQYFNFGPFFRSIGQVFKGKFNFMDIFSGAINIFIGLLELISMFIRLISFTFRLFGNMTAGEILILIAAFLIPLGINWVVYGLEILVGFIQALVFSGLTLAFVTMAVASHEAEAH